MNELLERTSMYEYEDTGASPQAPHHKDEETKPYEIKDGGDVAFGTNFVSDNPITPSDTTIADSSKSTDKRKIDGKKNSKVYSRTEGNYVHHIFMMVHIYIYTSRY